MGQQCIWTFSGPPYSSHLNINSRPASCCAASIAHCGSGEGLQGLQGLQVEAASEAHSFRGVEPHPVIPANAKNINEIFSKKLRPCNITSLLTTDLCLPSTSWKWNVVCTTESVYWDLKMRHNIPCHFICLCLAVWLCLKMGYENMVFVRLLQIGATDLTVRSALPFWPLKLCGGKGFLIGFKIIFFSLTRLPFASILA